MRRMSDGGANDQSDSGDGPGRMTTSEPRSQRPIGGMVRDPRQAKTAPSFTSFAIRRLATDVYRSLGTQYTNAIVRPTARACIRTEFTHFAIVDAATTAWRALEANVTRCMRAKIEPQGLQLQDFQMREVALSSQLQT